MPAAADNSNIPIASTNAQATSIPNGSPATANGSTSATPTAARASAEARGNVATSQASATASSTTTPATATAETTATSTTFPAAAMARTTANPTVTPATATVDTAAASTTQDLTAGDQNSGTATSTDKCPDSSGSNVPSLADGAAVWLVNLNTYLVQDLGPEWLQLVGLFFEHERLAGFPVHCIELFLWVRAKLFDRISRTYFLPNQDPAASRTGSSLHDRPSLSLLKGSIGRS